MEPAEGKNAARLETNLRQRTPRIKCYKTI